MLQTVEHELKLEAPEGFVLPDLGGEPLELRRFRSVYHDTSSRSLARAGITLRRRTERGCSVWQLKIPVDGARLELEEPGGPVRPPERLRGLIRAHERRDAVAPVADLRTRRHGALVGRNGTTAEVTLDEVSVMDGRRVDFRFTEVEIELKDGEPQVLARIAKELRGAGATPSAGMPKVFRVLDLNGAGPRASTPFDVLRERLSKQLDELLAHDPGTRLGADPESLHDMRVAVRRARALLRAGAELIASDTELLEVELQWLGGVLGDVRDLDVLLVQLKKAARELGPPDDGAGELLLRGLERQRTRARRVLVKALDGERYANVLDLFETSLASLERSSSKTSLDEIAGLELAKLAKHVKAAGKEPSDEQLHTLRKKGKRMRYAYELAGKTKVVKRARVFQDVLGTHQDAVVAEQRVRALSREAPPAQAVAAGLLIACERARRERARAEWRAAWRALAG